MRHKDGVDIDDKFSTVQGEGGAGLPSENKSVLLRLRNCKEMSSLKKQGMKWFFKSISSNNQLLPLQPDFFFIYLHK